MPLNIMIRPPEQSIVQKPSESFNCKLFRGAAQQVNRAIPFRRFLGGDKYGNVAGKLKFHLKVKPQKMKVSKRKRKLLIYGKWSG